MPLTNSCAVSMGSGRAYSCGAGSLIPTLAARASVRQHAGDVVVALGDPRHAALAVEADDHRRMRHVARTIRAIGHGEAFVAAGAECTLHVLGGARTAC